MAAKTKLALVLPASTQTPKSVKKNAECEAGTREHSGRSAAYDAGGQRPLCALVQSML